MKTMSVKTFLLFFSVFIAGGISVYILFKAFPLFSNSPKPIQPASKMKMEMAKGSVMVDTAQRQLYGIKVGAVKSLVLQRKIKTIGEASYSVPLEKTIVLKYGGYVKTLSVSKPGSEVYIGEPLFTVYSPELVNSENDFLLAYKNYKKLKNAQSGSGMEEAEAFLNATVYRLKSWGLTDSQLDGLKEGRPFKTDVTVYSPVSGVLVKKYIFSGSSFKAGQPLYKLAGLKRIWMDIWVYEKDLSFIHIGQKVKVRFDGYPGKTFYGKISFVYPYLSNKRVDEVRLVFDNADGKIKPGMYGNAEIMVKNEKDLAIPVSSVLITGGKPLVFVYKGRGYFIPKHVAIGIRCGAYYPVLTGLKKGERIVVSGTFLMSSDSNLSQTAGSMAGMPGM